MTNRDSFGQTQPTFSEDPLATPQVVRSYDPVGGDATGTQTERFDREYTLVQSAVIDPGDDLGVVYNMLEGFDYIILSAGSVSGTLFDKEALADPASVTIHASNGQFVEFSLDDPGFDPTAMQHGYLTFTFLRADPASEDNISSINAGGMAVSAWEDGSVTVQKSGSDPESNGWYAIYKKARPDAGRARSEVTAGNSDPTYIG